MFASNQLHKEKVYLHYLANAPRAIHNWTTCIYKQLLPLSWGTMTKTVRKQGNGMSPHAHLLIKERSAMLKHCTLC